ncbi:unnamed protein product, partial [Ixodes pacificus]
RLPLDVVDDEVGGVVQDGTVKVRQRHVRAHGDLARPFFHLLPPLHGLDLVEQALRAQELDVVLLEGDALVVQGLEVVLLVLVPPDLVEALLGLPPLLLLCL